MGASFWGHRFGGYSNGSSSTAGGDKKNMKQLGYACYSRSCITWGVDDIGGDGHGGGEGHEWVGGWTEVDLQIRTSYLGAKYKTSL